MNKIIILLVTVLTMLSPIVAQDSQAPTPAEAVALNAEEMKFKELLKNVTMSGRWYPVKDGSLGEQKDDHYGIVSIEKVKDDSWIVNTKLKYRERELTIPLPVQVKWAGDTPVIIVNNLVVPGGGTYSARVLFFEKTYSGSWTGQRGGGLLSGTINKNAD